MKTNIKLLLIFAYYFSISSAQNIPNESLIGNTVNPLMLKNSEYKQTELPTANIYQNKQTTKKKKKEEETLKELREKVNQSAINLRNSLDSVEVWAENPTPHGAVISYDPIASNYKRFEESPCFEKLGFSPFRTPEEQERMYQTCESEYYKNLMIKIVSSVLIFGFIAYMIYISLKKKKPLSSTTKHQNDIEDK